MKKTALLLVVAAILVIAQGSGVGAKETETLTGEFDWGGSNGDLEAVFTPAGDGKWEVDFHFDFRGPHVYSGTAEGSLSDGRLNGTVQNESKARIFTFDGSFEKGKFRGTHSEVTGGKERQTGTLTLRG